MRSINPLYMHKFTTVLTMLSISNAAFQSYHGDYKMWLFYIFLIDLTPLPTTIPRIGQLEHASSITPPGLVFQTLQNTVAKITKIATTMTTSQKNSDHISWKYCLLLATVCQWHSAYNSDHRGELFWTLARRLEAFYLLENFPDRCKGHAARLPALQHDLAEAT